MILICSFISAISSGLENVKDLSLDQVHRHWAVVPGIEGRPPIIPLEPHMIFGYDHPMDLLALRMGDPLADGDARVDGLAGNHDIILLEPIELIHEAIHKQDRAILNGREHGIPLGLTHNKYLLAEEIPRGDAIQCCHVAEDLVFDEALHFCIIYRWRYTLTY